MISSSSFIHSQVDVKKNENFVDYLFQHTDSAGSCCEPAGRNAECQMRVEELSQYLPRFLFTDWYLSKHCYQNDILKFSFDSW